MYAGKEKTVMMMYIGGESKGGEIEYSFPSLCLNTSCDLLQRATIEQTIELGLSYGFSFSFLKK